MRTWTRRIGGALVAALLLSYGLVIGLAAPVNGSSGSVDVKVCDYGHDGAMADCADAVFQVGTATKTQTSASPLKVYRYRVRWTSTAGGAVSANPFGLFHGKLLQIKFVPDAAGTQPTDLYDVTLVDEDALDYLGGAGANLSNAAPKLVLWDPPIMWHTSQAIDVVIANAGNAKSGNIYIWVQAAT